MTEVEAFWDALGRLTFAQVIKVAEIMRDAWETTCQFEPTDVQEWSFLLNTAREIAQAPVEDEA